MKIALCWMSKYSGNSHAELSSLEQSLGQYFSQGLLKSFTVKSSGFLQIGNNVKIKNKRSLGLKKSAWSYLQTSCYIYMVLDNRQANCSVETLNPYHDRINKSPWKNKDSPLDFLSELHLTIKAWYSKNNHPSV